jgi:hypothetical protein
MSNVGKPALYGLTHPTIGTFFPENHLMVHFAGNDYILPPDPTYKLLIKNDK